MEVSTDYIGNIKCKMLPVVWHASLGLGGTFDNEIHQTRTSLISDIPGIKYKLIFTSFGDVEISINVNKLEKIESNLDI